MKLFQNYSSYLRNTKEQNSFKNTSRIGSTGHINFDINIGKERPYSGVPSYRKINGVSPHWSIFNYFINYIFVVYIIINIIKIQY